MKLVIFGASGMIGRRITQEALDRGHNVTAAARHVDPFPLDDKRLSVIEGDVLNPLRVAAAVANQDAVLSAVGPSKGEDSSVIFRAARALITGCARVGTRRLVVVNGAGSLEVSPGVRLMDMPDFPPDWRAPALAHVQALGFHIESDLDWTAISPPALIEPGRRTGHYRIGTDKLLRDEKGESRISAEDYAVAFMDEVENPRYMRMRITVAY